MQQRQPGGGVAQDVADLPPGHRREPGDVAAVEQLHRVEGPQLVRPVVVGLDDARVPHARQRVVLALEERDVPGVRLSREPLQREGAPADLVDDPPDRRHPAFAEGAADAVPPGHDVPGRGFRAVRARPLGGCRWCAQDASCARARPAAARFAYSSRHAIAPFGSPIFEG